MVLGWLRMLRDEFSWSALQGGVEALAFMEREGGLDDAARLSTNSAVASILKEAALTSKATTRAVKKTPQTQLIFVLCFERVVMGEAALRFVRMMA